MKRVYQFDTNGFFTQTLVINDSDPIPLDCTETPINLDLYKNKRNGSAWTEGATQDEINEMKTVALPKETDSLKKQQADLTFQLMLAGVI